MVQLYSKYLTAYLYHGRRVRVNTFYNLFLWFFVTRRRTAPAAG